MTGRSSGAWRALSFGVALCAGLAAQAFGQAETTLSNGCTLRKDVYTCDVGAFQRVLAGAKTAAVETGPTDALAQDRLKKLVAAAGKTLVGKGEHADVTFLLVPVDPNGVQFTSGETRLATLHVFAARPDAPGRGDLVWADNYSGTADTQWFAVVSRLISQFEDKFHIKG